MEREAFATGQIEQGVTNRTGFDGTLGVAADGPWHATQQLWLIAGLSAAAVLWRRPLVLVDLDATPPATHT